MQDLSRVCTKNFFNHNLCLTSIIKQTLYSALNILTRRASPEGFAILRVISSYLQLDSYIGLDVHTVSTLAAIDTELLVFEAVLNVRASFCSHDS